MTMETEEYANILMDMADAQQDADFRASVPAGTELGETTLDGTPGAKAIWRKTHSGIKAGTQELPDRVPLWNLQVDTSDPAYFSMVPPTIAVKRMTEHRGKYTTRDPKKPLPEPIAETCDLCTRSRRGVPKPFYSLYDLEVHYQILHPNYWAMLERRRGDDDRKAEREQQAELIRTIRDMMAEQPARRGRKPNAEEG